MREFEDWFCINKPDPDHNKDGDSVMVKDENKEATPCPTVYDVSENLLPSTPSPCLIVPSPVSKRGGRGGSELPAGFVNKLLQQVSILLGRSVCKTDWIERS